MRHIFDASASVHPQLFKPVPYPSLFAEFKYIWLSDEDGHGFTVSASNGDVYKLKASDARNRQLWVDHLRSSAGGALLPHPSDLRYENI